MSSVSFPQARVYTLKFLRDTSKSQVLMHDGLISQHLLGLLLKCSVRNSRVLAKMRYACVTFLAEWKRVMCIVDSTKCLGAYHDNRGNESAQREENWSIFYMCVCILTKKFPVVFL